MGRDDVSARPIGGRYELRGLLGRGGMGSVWRGEDLVLQRPVAIKRVEIPAHLPVPERDVLRQRVLREARAAARVSHPKLVTIFDVVEEDGTVFLVQELVDAPTLKAMVAERGPLPPSEVVRIGRQLVDGLAAAHRNGVVHRDVKPSNVMVLADGAVKLADFGIASVHGDPQITATGVVMGSPAYMAPEQAVGSRAGPQADLWSLGATLYFAVEGEAPFGRGDTLSTLTAVVHEAPRQTAKAGPLAPVLEQLLAKDPAQRPGAAEVMARLDGLLRRAERPTSTLTQVGDTARLAPPAAPAAAAPPPAPAAAAPPPAPSTPPAGPSIEGTAAGPLREPPEAGARPRRRHLGAATLLVLVALGAGVAMAAAVGGRGGDEPERSDAAASQTPAGVSTTIAGPGTTTTAPPTAGAVPSGWARYQDPKTGYTVAYPAGWTVQARDATRTDFTDPATGAYLRVDWTDEPGESAQADWERQSKSFGRRHTGYEEIRIEPTTFLGSSNASLWEYRYTADGATLHAYDLGFVLDDDYGFALNFQSPEEQWSASQATWEQLKAGFGPPQGG